MTLEHLIGIGARSVHFQDIIEKQPKIGWLEVHSENFFAHGGMLLDVLKNLRASYPISFHGVGLSLGSQTPVHLDHLKSLQELIIKFDPKFISEHLSWGFVEGQYLPDLLPVPYDENSFENFKRNICQTQDYLERQILIENPSSYFEYKQSCYQEVDFLVRLSEQTGCALLLDINNIFVSCSNHRWDPIHYLESIPADLVQEIHLAGHSEKILNSGEKILIDTHDREVCQSVWDLYDKAIKRFGPTPTLLEFDAQIPSLENLIEQAQKSLSYMQAS